MRIILFIIPFFISCSNTKNLKENNLDVKPLPINKARDTLFIKDSILLKKFHDESIELPAIQNNSPIIFK